MDWETCMTMNNTWGYSEHDQNWKSSEALIRLACPTRWRLSFASSDCLDASNAKITDPMWGS